MTMCLEKEQDQITYRIQLYIIYFISLLLLLDCMTSNSPPQDGAIPAVCTPLLSFLYCFCFYLFILFYFNAFQKYLRKSSLPKEDIRKAYSLQRHRMVLQSPPTISTQLSKRHTPTLIVLNQLLLLLALFHRVGMVLYAPLRTHAALLRLKRRPTTCSKPSTTWPPLFEYVSPPPSPPLLLE